MTNIERIICKLKVDKENHELAAQELARRDNFSDIIRMIREMNHPQGTRSLDLAMEEIWLSMAREVEATDILSEEQLPLKLVDRT